MVEARLRCIDNCDLSLLATYTEPVVKALGRCRTTAYHPLEDLESHFMIQGALLTSKLKPQEQANAMRNIFCIETHLDTICIDENHESLSDSLDVDRR